MNANVPITFFTTCKPFKGEANILQRNALRSWSALGVPIIICGTEEGVKEACSEFGAQQIASIEYNKRGTPLIRSIFSEAEEKAVTPFLAYLNADILVQPNMLKTMLTVTKNYENASRSLLMTSRRRNIPLGEELQGASQKIQHNLDTLDEQYGVWDQSNAIDLFLFSRGLFDEIIPLVVGHMQWDNWLLWKAQKCGADIVDVSLEAALLHPIHGYQSDGTGLQQRTQGEQAAKNRELAKGQSTDLDQATSHYLYEGKIHKTSAEFKRLLQQTCQTEHDTELKAGLQYLSTYQYKRSPRDIVDCYRTVLWRYQRYFPFLEGGEANPETIFKSVDQAAQLSASENLREAANTLQDIVCGPLLKKTRAASNAGKLIYIWGCGQAGERLMNYLKRHEIEIAGFLDSSPEKTGKIIAGTAVIDSTVLTSKARKTAFIIIASMYLKEIAEHLEKQGFIRHLDYSG